MKLHKQIYIIIFISSLLFGCSTVEKYGYYTPTDKNGDISGPFEPACGWKNFDGEPDSFIPKDDNSLSVSAYQYWHPYLWGPWFVSIVPVFPITWLAEPFINDNLRIVIKGIDEQIQLETASVIINSERQEERILHPKTIDRGRDHAILKFPVDSDKIKEFIFILALYENDTEPIKIQFKKTNRWSWTQQTPNC